ncbi:hypothetical protein Nans01_45330 [Nocardiopsis ansamitocini]|uniref:Secreted protein n=2 Tax=Nocardiopsis ansamitocini TaxID=1670832 RepID=A0A9W6PAX9_9ACTN|nr:hypothetical protein Nans01_45330 [Nocardiopsis ansamitocini]
MPATVKVCAALLLLGVLPTAPASAAETSTAPAPRPSTDAAQQTLYIPCDGEPGLRAQFTLRPIGAVATNLNFTNPCGHLVSVRVLVSRSEGGVRECLRVGPGTRGNKNYQHGPGGGVQISPGC